MRAASLKPGNSLQNSFKPQLQAASSLQGFHLPTPSQVPPQCTVSLKYLVTLGTLEDQWGLYNGGSGPHVRVVVCLMSCLPPVLDPSSGRPPPHPLLFHRLQHHTHGALSTLSVSPSTCLSLVRSPSPLRPHFHDARTCRDARGALALTQHYPTLKQLVFNMYIYTHLNIIIFPTTCWNSV